MPSYKKSATPAPRLIPLRDACAIFATSETTIRRLIERGELTPYKLSNRMLLDPEEVTALAAKKAGR